MSAPESDKAAIRQIIRALKAAGWALTFVDDREEETPVKGEQEAIDVIMGVDEAFMHVQRDGVNGYVFFVLGNDPEEVACDYTVNLGDVIDPLTDSWF